MPLFLVEPHLPAETILGRINDLPKLAALGHLVSIKFDEPTRTSLDCVLILVASH